MRQDFKEIELEFKSNHSIKSKVLKYVVTIIIKHANLLFKL